MILLELHRSKQQINMYGSFPRRILPPQPDDLRFPSQLFSPNPVVFLDVHHPTFVTCWSPSFYPRDSYGVQANSLAKLTPPL